MSKTKSIIKIVIIFLFLVVFHSNYMNLFSNIFTAFRKNNLDELTKESYEQKIEYLEQSLSNYEMTLENLSIYKKDSYVLSKIALRNIYDFYNTLTISTEYPVEKGSAVINEFGLVGVVSSSNKNTAIVDLISKEEINISVKVGSSYGILDGYDKKEDRLIIKNINNYANITEGMIVNTSGLQEIKPNIKIGTVTKVQTIGVEQVVYVKPFVQLDELNYLMVISQ